MRWPLMRHKTHMAIYTRQGEAYRSEIQEARWEAERERYRLKEFVDSLAPRVHDDRAFTSGNVVLRIEVDARLLRDLPSNDLLLLVRDSIMRRLLDAARDHRGDLRQTPTQRALGL